MPSPAPRHVDLLRPPFTAEQRHSIGHFLAQVPELGDDQRLALAAAAPDAAATPEPLSILGLLTPAGYGQLVRRAGGSWLELAVPPGPDELGAARAILEAALGDVRDHGGTPVHLWQHTPTPARRAVAEDAGFVADRTLLQMRAALPVPAARRGGARPLALRPFRPGADDDAWLAANNRAFADHPEQGAWTRQELEARQQEPWFDPAGFLVLEENGEVVGSCWTKVHHDPDGRTEPEGEIYVISVDPGRHGEGLGRALTVAGLDWIAGRGIRRGMLFVDAANVAAVALYRSLGFTVSRVDEASIAYP